MAPDPKLRKLQEMHEAATNPYHKVVLHKKITQHRKAGAKGAHVARAHAASFDNYNAFLFGLNKQLNKDDGSADPKDVAPADPAQLLNEHLALLVDLQKAFKDRRNKPDEALAIWERIDPSIHAEVEAARSTVDSDTVKSVESQLERAGRRFVGAAYGAAEKAAEGHLEAPDIEEQRAHFQRAVQELVQAKSLWDKSGEVMKIAGKPLASLDANTKEVLELVALPGEIQDKLEEAKKKSGLGQVGTAVQLVGKIKGGTMSLLKMSAKAGEHYCTYVAALPATQANKVMLKEVEEAAEQWKWVGETAEAMGTVASIVSLIGDAISLVDSIREGKWDEVASEAADMAVDAAPLVLGAEVAAPLAGAVVLVKAELFAIHAAAEFIRYCKDEIVRQATAAYIKGLTDDVYAWGNKLCADVEVMLDPTVAASVQQAAQGQVQNDAAKTWQGMRSVIATYLEPLAQKAPAAYQSMGSEALSAFDDMTYPAETKDGVIELTVLDKTQKIFHGANLMAKYVHEHYTN